MTDTPTPVPAASERMTAERLAELREMASRERFIHDPNPIVGDLIALVDKQAEELASAKRAAQIENAKLVELDDRIQSLERELAAVTASRDGWRKKCTDAFVTETKAIDAAERDR